MSMRRFLPLLLILCGVFWITPALAQTDAPRPLTAIERAREAQSAWEAASRAATRGPAIVPLRGEATLALPAGMMFIPEAPALRLVRAQGDTGGPNLVGLVTTPSDDDHWMVFVTWTAEGFVRDDEAKDLSADDILQSLRDGTAEANKDRAARGFPELEVLGWVQPPGYEAATHRLTWSLRVAAKGEAPGDAAVNYNTRVLGREGYFSLNLVTPQSDIEKDKPVAGQLLSAFGYDDGKRYSDFNAATDKVAEYGLLALIGVVAAKKLGFLALIAAFAAKFAKVGVLAVAGGLLAVKRLFRRKPTS